MAEYKGNSFKQREQEKEAKQEKQVVKVVKGVVKSRKKGELQKLRDVFIEEDIDTVKERIFIEIIKPTVKRLVYNIIEGSASMMLGQGSGNGGKHGSVSRVRYDGYFDDPRSKQRDYASTSVRNALDYDDIIFDNRGDAELVLSAMEDILAKYRFVSVADLFELADISNNNFTTNKYGWADLQSARVVPTRGGYMLRLPRAVPLD